MKEDKNIILDVAQKWNSEDLNVIALTYAPIPHHLEHIFSNFNTNEAIYLVENRTEEQAVATMEKIRKDVIRRKEEKRKQEEAYGREQKIREREELKKKAADLRRELLNARVAKANQQLKNPLKLRALRRDIARVLTVIRESENAKN